MTVILLFAVLSTPASAQQAAKLGSGASVEILGVGPMLFGSGEKALMAKYRTNLALDDMAALRREADEVWDQLVAGAEKGGFTQAIVSANQPQKGLIVTTNKGYNFIYEKKDGAWRTLEPKGAGKLDERSLRDLMSRLDWYHDHKEMNALLTYLAPDWTGAFPGPDGKPIIFDRMKFAGMTYGMLTHAATYSHKREITKVTVSADGASAEVESREQEEVTADGRTQKADVSSKDSFAWRDGSILLVKSSSILAK